VRQWRQHGPVGFLRRYLGSYLELRMKGYGHDGAYRRIPFEVEADRAAIGAETDAGTGGRSPLS
jgi:hypothetical protein